MATETAERVPLQTVMARYVDLVLRLAGSQQTGVYLVGSPALGDFSARQSNIDLVTVTEDALPPELTGQLAAAHRSLRHNGCQAGVCYTTWESLRRPPNGATAAVYEGRGQVDPGQLANPMTWSILAGSPVPVSGPADPEVHSDPDQVRAWFGERLPAVAARTGSLLWRRHLTRVVLQATRAAHGALTGEVLSLRQAGELALPAASHTSHRVITDALGYREGANTSMYWGPFERKVNATTLTNDLLRRVREASTA